MVKCVILGLMVLMVGCQQIVVETPTPTIIRNTPVVVTDTPQPHECLCDRDRYNCEDFRSQAEARECWLTCRFEGKGDVHGLDGDDDRVVCELLP